jgi:hypothetical protein
MSNESLGVGPRQNCQRQTPEPSWSHNSYTPLEDERCYGKGAAMLRGCGTLPPASCLKGEPELSPTPNQGWIWRSMEGLGPAGSERPGKKRSSVCDDNGFLLLLLLRPSVGRILRTLREPKQAVRLWFLLHRSCMARKPRLSLPISRPSAV